MAARELISGGSPEQIEARFPKLNDSQIAGLAAFGQQRDAQPHEVILERGDLHHGIFVVLRGRIEVLRVSAEGETVLHTLDRGEFTGDVNLLSGRGTLIRARALEASALLEIDRANLRHIMQTDAALGEIFLKAFVLRRVFLISNSVGDAVLIGSNHSSDMLRLREFLACKGQPHCYLDVEVDPDVQTVLDQFEIPLADIPVLICRGTVALRNPSNSEVARCSEYFRKPRINLTRKTRLVAEFGASVSPCACTSRHTDERTLTFTKKDVRRTLSATVTRSSIVTLDFFEPYNDSVLRA